jgi:hypothetical protein
MVSIGGASLPNINISVEGARQLEEQLAEIGKLPKRVLTTAAKAGYNPILAQARANATPYTKSGMMKRGIKATLEQPNKRNKAVYRINWWGKYSDFYKKKIKKAGIYGGQRNPAYYPQSVEWGFPNAKGYVKGKYFIRSAIEQHQAESAQKVIDTLSSEIEKLTQ